MHSLVDKLQGDIAQMKCEEEEMKENVAKLKQSLLDFQQCATKLVPKLVSKQDETIQLLKEIIENGQFLGGLLSLTGRNAIVAEVKSATELFRLGIRDNDVKDLVDIFDPSLFNKLLKKMKTECPTISNVLEQLVLSVNASRNTIKTLAMKMKAALLQMSEISEVEATFLSFLVSCAFHMVPDHL